MAPPWSPDVFAYMDFRCFLQDYYEAAKEKRRGGYSYRQFTEHIGYRSCSFLPGVIAGKRNFSVDRLGQVTRGMKLNAEEAQFFELLVRYGQSEDEERRQELLDRLLAMRRFQNSVQLAQEHLTVLSRWYYAAIREMVACNDFVEDPEWIGQHLLPPIQAELVRECIHRLLALGLLSRDEEGVLILGEPGEELAFTGHEALQAQGSRNYHTAMLQCAADSIHLVPSHRRHLDALTFGIRREQLPEVRRRINQLLETTLAFCEQETPPEEVYQLHVVFFPLTNMADGE